MDQHLIAPVPDGKKRAGIWRVNEERLDDRIEGQRDLVAIARKSVIPLGRREILTPENSGKVCVGEKNIWPSSTEATMPTGTQSWCGQRFDIAGVCLDLG